MEQWQFPIAMAMIVLAGLTVTWKFVQFVRSLLTGHGCGSGCGRCQIEDDEPATQTKISLPMINKP